jgi:hypothetical protein
MVWPPKAIGERGNFAHFGKLAIETSAGSSYREQWFVPRPH